MKDLAQHERELLELLREHTRMAPKKAATALGWTKEQLSMAKTDLASKGLIRLGRGGSMEVNDMANGNGQVSRSAGTPPKDVA